LGELRVCFVSESSAGRACWVVAGASSSASKARVRDVGGAMGSQGQAGPAGGWCVEEHDTCVDEKRKYVSERKFR
jgi:hypothetical protein